MKRKLLVTHRVRAELFFIFSHTKNPKQGKNCEAFFQERKKKKWKSERAYFIRKKRKAILYMWNGIKAEFHYDHRFARLHLNFQFKIANCPCGNFYELIDFFRCFVHTRTKKTLSLLWEYLCLFLFVCLFVDTSKKGFSMFIEYGELFAF